MQSGLAARPAFAPLSGSRLRTPDEAYPGLGPMASRMAIWEINRPPRQEIGPAL